MKIPDRETVFEQIGDYYDQLVDQHGYTPRACDYGDPRSQEAKFEVLADVIDSEPCEVLDVGCGFADFGDFLRKRCDNVSYTGIDLSERMIDQARRTHPQADLRHGNILDQNLGTFDYVFANGIFYLLGDHAESTMRDLIERMWDLADRAVAFNSLSTWAPDQEPDEFHADPLDVLDFCRTLTKRVTLRHDYHPRDFTVYLQRGGFD